MTWFPSPYAHVVITVDFYKLVLFTPIILFSFTWSYQQIFNVQGERKMNNPYLTVFGPPATVCLLQSLLNYMYFGESAGVVTCAHKQVQSFTNRHWLFSSHLPHPTIC